MDRRRVLNWSGVLTMVGATGAFAAFAVTGARPYGGTPPHQEVGPALPPVLAQPRAPGRPVISFHDSAGAVLGGQPTRIGLVSRVEDGARLPGHLDRSAVSGSRSPDSSPGAGQPPGSGAPADPCERPDGGKPAGGKPAGDKPAGGKPTGDGKPPGGDPAGDGKPAGASKPGESRPAGTGEPRREKSDTPRRVRPTEARPAKRDTARSTKRTHGEGHAERPSGGHGASGKSGKSGKSKEGRSGGGSGKSDRGSSSGSGKGKAGSHDG